MSNVEIKQCIFTKNDCYKKGKTVAVHKKIVVHSSGANNPNLKRYVQPDDGILGDNPYNNDWNRSGVNKCVHAMIGKDKNGTVRIYQTLPWNYCCWGCGSGQKGSYNDSAIQFEILEDNLTDKAYFDKAFTTAIELCAYLCKTLGISVDNIVSHKEAYALGYASNHGDCDNWLKKFGKDMDWFRREVDKIVNPPVQETAVKFTVGQKVKLTKGALYTNGKAPKSWVYARELYVRKVSGEKVQVSIYSSGAVTGTVYAKDLVSVEGTASTSTSSTTTAYYGKYTGKSAGLDTILKAIGVPEKYLGNWKNRKTLAEANGISNYKGNIFQNSKLKNLAKTGKLKRV